MWARLFKGLVYANIYVSGATVLLAQAGIKVLGTPAASLQPYQMAFLFLSTYVTYNLNSVLLTRQERLQGHSEKYFWAGRYLRFIQVSFVVALLALLVLCWYMRLAELLFFGHLALISVLYNVPQQRLPAPLKPLRNIPLLKVFLISYVWTGVAVLYPGVLLQQSWQAGTVVYATSFGLFIMAITLPFDIRDFRTDFRKELVTFPQVIGMAQTRLLALIVLLASWGLLLAFQGPFYWLLLPVYALSGVCIWAATPQRPELYYTGIIDGLMVLYGLGILAWANLF